MASRAQAWVVIVGLLVALSIPGPARGQAEVTTAPPPQTQQSHQNTLLPMSIPVLVTQSKKLKAHNEAKYERRCQYAPRR